MTSSVAGLRRSSKAFTKAKLAPKKVMVPVWWSAADMIHYSFLNPRWNWGGLHWKVWPAKWWDALKAAMPAPGTGQQKGPILHINARPPHTTNVSKVEWIGLSRFASSATFTWPLADWLPLLQVSQQPFVGKTLPQSARGQKCFPRVCWILKRGFLCYRNKQTYCSLAKMWLSWFLFWLLKLYLSLAIMI